MNAVLRIALTYFQMLSLQRWLNLAGLLLLACAVLVGVISDSANAPGTVFTLCTFAVTLILLVPAFGGGAAMRQASRPAIAHLRPHGRVKLLLGATLAVCLVALITTLPTLGAHWVIELHDLPPVRRFSQPLNALLFFMPIAMLGWIAMFVASRTLFVAVVFPVLPMAAMKLPTLYRMYPAFTPLHLLAIAVAAWAVFALWYLRAGHVRPPSKGGMNACAGSGQFAIPWLMDREDSGASTSSPALATLHYLLGTGSYRLFAVTGAWTAAVFVAVSLFTPKPQSDHGRLLLFMMPFLSFQCAVMGYTTARRARLLWLRTGADRRGLFALAENLGLRASMTTWGIVCGAALIFILFAAPGRATLAVTFAAAQGVAAVCMFYVGLALVRNWRASDVVLSVSFLLLLIVQMILANPGSDLQRMQPLITLAIATALVLPLRWYALRRWQGLDWRLIAPPKLDWRRS